MKILLVEDDRKLARAVTSLLDEDGHDVALAHDGERAAWSWGSSSRMT